MAFRITPPSMVFAGVPSTKLVAPVRHEGIRVLEELVRLDFIYVDVVIHRLAFQRAVVIAEVVKNVTTLPR